MTTKPFDQFNKRLFETLLSPFGTVTPNRSVLGEERAIDIYFEPNPDVLLPRDELGYLTFMLDKPALLEPFRSSLSDEDMHNCLLKLFLVYAEYRRQNESMKTENLPRLWMLCASVSNRLIEEFNGQLDERFGEGFYRLAPRLRATIVVIDELPTTPETLWLRLMGRGRTQEDAISELLLLPENDALRVNVLNLLVSWRISIDLLEQADNEERRILMALSQAYLEWEQQTRRQGLEQGQQQERQRTIVKLLELRFGTIDDELQAIIPTLMELSSEEFLPILMQRSRDELLQQFLN